MTKLLLFFSRLCSSFPSLWKIFIIRFKIIGNEPASIINGIIIRAFHSLSFNKYKHKTPIHPPIKGINEPALLFERRGAVKSNQFAILNRIKIKPVIVMIINILRFKYYLHLNVLATSPTLFFPWFVPSICQYSWHCPRKSSHVCWWAGMSYADWAVNYTGEMLRIVKRHKEVGCLFGESTHLEGIYLIFRLLTHCNDLRSKWYLTKSHNIAFDELKQLHLPF